MPTRLPTEEEIEAWDLATLLEYGRAGLRSFAGDHDELIQRRNVLITSRFGDLNAVLREVVMLSLAAEDIPTVHKVVGWLEDAGDPAMGYYVYRTMADRGEADKAERFLISAASHGHFPAQRVLSDRKAKEHGVLSPFFFVASRVAHAWRVALVVRQNPKDLRLK
ncbi:hypothetical protein [Marivita hallyeonensis]|uniref:Uncharacterized protein n=1 Tax=Marivita hallyeonensis TaxID=996342 RepID=A0A1M5VRR8_9RHOB|nr:hypothetical protein [Marivita hallyeonensis]SHH77952.1 hypothetical protein SAMN05443551_3036 [Marivita hallyeonensis]